jgi:hypothetical protein
MVANYTKLYEKETIFGKFITEPDFNICEIGTSEKSDEQFKMTVSNLD